MDSYEWNKIFGAILATALLIMAINIGVDMAMKPHKAEKPGIALAEGTDDHGGGGAKPVAEDTTPPDWGTLLPAADIAAGDKVHKKCVQCHTFENGGKNGIGPNLWNIVGANHARTDGFAYSNAIKAKPGPWTYDELYAFIKKPNVYAPGTKMAFAGIPKREDRINLIAWMRTMSDAPQPIPAPNPAAAPAAPADGAAPAAPAEGAPAAPADGAPAAPAAPADGAPAVTPPATPEGAAAPAPALPAPAAPSTETPAGAPATPPAPAPVAPAATSPAPAVPAPAPH